MVQPVLTGLVEVALWSAIFATTGAAQIGGFPRESYLAYALWAVFFARASTNWMYEFKMIDEIDTGSINSVLARPISFYEYYLSQFLGYKFISNAIAFTVPVAVCLIFPGTTLLHRFPLACLLLAAYLVLVFTISYGIAASAFFFNRVHSFTVAKNIAFWMLSGELFPLDLVPEPFRGWLLALPFASGVYVPVGYLTGRLEIDAVMRGFVSIGVSLAIIGALSQMVWVAGRRSYSGTGA